MILTLALLAQFFFGEYYGEPSGCNWCCVEGDDPIELPLCNPSPSGDELPHLMDWPIVRLEPQTGYGFHAPKIGFDYIVSGPFHETRNYHIDWRVLVFVGFEEANQVFPSSVTGTVPLTLLVNPEAQVFMTRQRGGSYTYVISVPDDPAWIGRTVYHQTVMYWWSAVTSKLRIVSSRGVKTTVED